MLRLPRSGGDWPTAACEEDQRYSVSSPVMGGFDLVYSHDEDMLIYYSIIVQLNLKHLPNHIIRY